MRRQRQGASPMLRVVPQNRPTIREAAERGFDLGGGLKRMAQDQGDFTRLQRSQLVNHGQYRRFRDGPGFLVIGDGLDEKGKNAKVIGMKDRRLSHEAFKMPVAWLSHHTLP